MLLVSTIPSGVSCPALGGRGGGKKRRKGKEKVLTHFPSRRNFRIGVSETLLSFLRLKGEEGGKKKKRRGSWVSVLTTYFYVDHVSAGCGFFFRTVVEKRRGKKKRRGGRFNLSMLFFLHPVSRSPAPAALLPTRAKGRRKREGRGKMISLLHRNAGFPLHGLPTKVRRAIK